MKADDEIEQGIRSILRKWVPRVAMVELAETFDGWAT